MGIYIKGLQMPKGEFESLDLSIDSDGKVYIDERDWFGQHTYKLAGEAVSISDHGDLIDRDALYIDLMDRGVDQLQLSDFAEIADAVDDAPAIIKAERNEDGKYKI